MSFGFSPSDLVKLVEISTRVYIAFKDANENSEAQVEALVREFQNFARCLVELDKLMKKFGRPLPFPVDDVRKTLDKCEASLKPYEESLVDRKMSFSKIVWTIKYIGKENELESLRKLITGQYQALTVCLHVMQLELNLESSRREQRLMVEPRLRSQSLGSPPDTAASGPLSTSPQTSPLALPAPEDAHSLYKDWKKLNQWLKSEHDRIDDDLEIVQHSLAHNHQATTHSDDTGTAALLYRLQCRVEDAIAFEENRAKRAAAERRYHLAPSDATRHQVRETLRTYTIDSEDSTIFHRFETPVNMSDSAATVRPGPSSPSPRSPSSRTSPSASPQIEQEFFRATEWVHSPTFLSSSPDLARTSVSTNRSSISMSSDGRLSPLVGLGVSTAGTTPEIPLSHTIRSVLSSASLATISLGDAAFKWTPLCRKVEVERKWLEQVGGKERVFHKSHECDVQWKYREDGGMSLRAVFKSKDDGKARLWTTQDFPALGPSIPLTTTIDNDTSIDFPRGSFGKLDKHWIDIKYTFASSEASAAFQTLLYTNNGKEAADLLFDRPVRTISSDKNRPECRGRNLRLWRRTEMHLEPNGLLSTNVLVLLFYTSCLGEKGHWVEEPHYSFEWLAESVYTKSSDKLTLVFSKDPSRWTPDKLFQRRKSSQVSVSGSAPTSPVTAMRRDSMEIPGITRTGTGESAASSTVPLGSPRSSFSRSKTSSTMSRLNRFGYAKLDIEFQSSTDRKAFLDVWQKYVKPLRTLA